MKPLNCCRQWLSAGPVVMGSVLSLSSSCLCSLRPCRVPIRASSCPPCPAWSLSSSTRYQLSYSSWRRWSAGCWPSSPVQSWSVRHRSSEGFLFSIFSRDTCDCGQIKVVHRTAWTCALVWFTILFLVPHRASGSPHCAASMLCPASLNMR